MWTQGLGTATMPGLKGKPNHDDTRVRMQRLEVAGLSVTVASIYGDCDDQDKKT